MIRGVTAPVPMLDLARQFAGIRDEVLLSIAGILDSQALILGPAVEQFEVAAAAVCGVPFAAGCASGTDALWLALAAARIGPGDAVLTTPFSFFATVSSILRAGATPSLQTSTRAPAIFLRPPSKRPWPTSPGPRLTCACVPSCPCTSMASAPIWTPSVASASTTASA